MPATTTTTTDATADSAASPKPLDPAALARLHAAIAAFACADRFDNLAEHVAVGEALVAAFYEGRIDLWRGYNGEDGRSTRRVVADLKRLGYASWNRYRVERCIRLYEQDLFHGGLRKWDILGTSQWVALQVLPLDQQRPFVEETQKKVLSFPALKAAIRRWRGERPSGLASPDAIYHWVSLVRRAVGDYEHQLGDLRRYRMKEEELLQFQAAFGAFERALEALVLALGKLGADVPVPEMNALLARKAR